MKPPKNSETPLNMHMIPIDKVRNYTRKIGLQACQCTALTKNHHKQLSDFFAAENAITLNAPQCDHHRKTAWSLCKALASDTCLQDREAYFSLLNNMELKIVAGQPELHAKYVYNVDPQNTFRQQIVLFH